MENFVGKNMESCHKPETMEKLKSLYQACGEKKRKFDYCTMTVPDGILTVVNVPFHNGDTFTPALHKI